jgi:hypothetical protein
MVYFGYAQELLRHERVIRLHKHASNIVLEPAAQRVIERVT